MPDKKPPSSLHGLSLDESIFCALENFLAATQGQEVTNLHAMVINEVERPLLRAVLIATQNNQTKAADMLGISRATLRRKLKDALYLDG